MEYNIANDQIKSFTYLLNVLCLFASASIPCKIAAIKFVMNHQQLQSEIEEVLKEMNCSVSRPDSCDMQVKLIIDLKTQRKDYETECREIAEK